jgi:amino-acid N-acetyltransferase
MVDDADPSDLSPEDVEAVLAAIDRLASQPNSETFAFNLLVNALGTVLERIRLSEPELAPTYLAAAHAMLEDARGWLEQTRSLIMISSLILRPLLAEDADWPAFQDLLVLAGLPVPDTEDDARFFAVDDELGLVGFGGLHGHSTDQLLRSIVVAPGLRRRGMGHVLVHRLVEQARSGGAQRLWLLTSEADRFFADLGWAAAPRVAAPAAVRSSRLYSEICPATTVLMVRSLA